VEYSAELLRLVRKEGAGENRGVLYGKRSDSRVRLLAARPARHRRDLKLAGMERVGVFAVRDAGEVFLTEQDLEFTERHGADLALILAGDRGGFFVRESAGIFLTVRSHEEFSAEDRSAKKRAPIRTWMNVTALAICIAVSVGAVSYAQPKAALTLHVREVSEQLAIEWTPRVSGTLTIADGARSVEIPVSAYETRATFAPQGSRIDVRLSTAEGLVREERVERAGSAAGLLTDEIAWLEEEHEKLLAEANENAVRLARLEKQLHPSP
jgi:hypothetical protein